MHRQILRLAAGVFVAGSLGLACSSSSSGDNTSLQGTWCNADMGADGFTFGPGGMCLYEVNVSSGSMCSSQCSYQVSGSTLTMTATSGGQLGSDAGATTTTCSYALTFSNSGNTLEIKSDGGQSGCPTLDATVKRSGPATLQSCSFGC
jgi:hypothetical protein